MVAGSSCGTGKCLGLIRALGPRAPGLRVSVAAGCISRALQWLWAAEPCPGPAVLGAANRPPGECPSGVLGSPGQPGACSCPVPPEAAPPSSSCSSCPPRQGGTALGCLWLWGPFTAQLGIPAHPLQARSCQWLRAQLHLCSRPGDVCDRAGRQVLPLLPGVWGCKNPLSPAPRPMHPGSAYRPPPRHGLSLAGGDSEWAAEPAGRGQAVETQARCSQRPCWAVGRSLEGLVPRVGVHPWGQAVLAGEQLCYRCRACRQEAGGSWAAARLC